MTSELFSLIRDKLNGCQNIKVAIDRDEEDYEDDLNEGLVLNDNINESLLILFKSSWGDKEFITWPKNTSVIGFPPP